MFVLFFCFFVLFNFDDYIFTVNLPKIFIHLKSLPLPVNASKNC